MDATWTPWTLVRNADIQDAQLPVSPNLPQPEVFSQAVANKSKKPAPFDGTKPKELMDILAGRAMVATAADDGQNPEKNRSDKINRLLPPPESLSQTLAYFEKHPSELIVHDPSAASEGSRKRTLCAETRQVSERFTHLLADADRLRKEAKTPHRLYRNSTKNPRDLHVRFV